MAGRETSVSFTVRRPTPVSRAGSSGLDSDAETFKVPALPRHLNGNGRSRSTSPLPKGSQSSLRHGFNEDDSSAEEDENVDEIVTGFDKFGVQRCVELVKYSCPGPQLKEGSFVDRLKEKNKEGPLVIPALANKDWREVARKRKAVEMFVPGGAVKTGADGSVGGLGTKDSIHAGPQLSGLVVAEKRLRMDVDMNDAKVDASEEITNLEKQEETEDEKAIRALMANALGENDDNEVTIDTIPSGSNNWTRPADETDAFRQDVITRPDEASLDDYDRVPVEQFGAALMRGMGWKPGEAASRTRKGPVEPYLPASRPALLGIGAKEREALDDGSKMKKSTRPERRYVPVVKKDKEGSSSDLPREGERDVRRSHSRDKRSNDREIAKGRERSPRDKDYDARRDRERRSERHEYDGRERRKERDYDKDHARDRDSRRGDGRGDRDSEVRRRDRDRDGRRQ